MTKTPRKLTREEIRALTRPEATVSTPAPINPDAERQWKEVFSAADRKHKGEQIPVASNVKPEQIESVQALGSGEIGLSRPTESRVTDSPLVRVVSNFSSGDYILNVEPRHPKRPWGHPDDIIAAAIIRHLQTVIPRTVKVDIKGPAMDWDIRLFTFTARGLLNQWNVSLEKVASVEKSISLDLQQYCVR